MINKGNSIPYATSPKIHLKSSLQALYHPSKSMCVTLHERFTWQSSRGPRDSPRESRNGGLREVNVATFEMSTWQPARGSHGIPREGHTTASVVDILTCALCDAQIGPHTYAADMDPQ